MSDKAREYQSRETGAPPGWVYKIGDVSFDGYKNGVLLDAKDHYSQFLVKGSRPVPKEWFDGFEGRGGFVDRATAQVKAAKGVRIQWRFSEKEVADYVRDLFRGKPELRSIEIVHSPRTP